MNAERQCKNSSGGKILQPFIMLITGHWPAMASGTALALLATLAAIGLLALSGWFIAAAALAGLNQAAAQIFNFFFPSIGVRLLAIIRTGARYGERIVSHDATFRILETLRAWCYRRIEPLVPARLGRHHSADLLARIITDIDTLDNLYLRVLSPTAVSAATITILFFFILDFHSLIALTSTGILLTAAICIPVLAQWLGREAARNLNDHHAGLRTTLVDGLHGLAALLSCGAEGRFLAHTARDHRDLVADQYRMSRITGLTAALMGLASGAAVVATLYIGSRAVVSGLLTAPLLAMLTLAVIAAFDAIVMLPTAYQYLGQTRKAAARLHAVTDMEPAVDFPQRTCRPDAGWDIEFHDVGFQYQGNDQPVLENVHLRIGCGRRIAVMGPTGAGKSTLLYLLARFEDPTKGEIRLGGLPLCRYSEDDLRKKLCIVDQKAHIFSGTIRDNLAMADSRADDEALFQALAVTGLSGFVEDLPDGLQTWVGEAGRLLSGGQARRLAIARAVLSEAPVWVFDEPTEGLDRDTAASMMASIMEAGRDKTIIMITHRPEALRFMDEIVVLEHGRIITTKRRVHAHDHKNPAG